LINDHESGRTPLHIAVELKSLPLSILQVLLDNYPEDITKKDKYGNTPLSIAKKNNVNDVIIMLEWYKNMSPEERAYIADGVKRERDAYLAERAENDRRNKERREEATREEKRLEEERRKEEMRKEERLEEERRKEERLEEERLEEARLNSNTGEVPEKFVVTQNYINSIRTKKNIEPENTGEFVAKKTNIAQKYLDSIRNKGGKSNKKRSRKHKLRRKRSLHKKK
jgi:hypothetical protein